MATRTFTLTYPAAPKSLNAGGAGSRRPWYIAHREKQLWEGLFAGLLLAEKVPVGMLFCEVDAVIRWKVKRGRDVDNFIPALVKPLADVLQKGWLPNDTPEFFHFGDLEFSYPKPWPYADPRIKAETVVHLTARYPEAPAAPQDERGSLDAR